MADLGALAKQLVTSGKGILAADESTKSANKRLGLANIEQTADNRRRWRNLLFATAGLEQYLTGVILHEETFGQTTLVDDVAFPDFLQHKNILPGIKVDGGLVPMPGSPSENYTEGLDGLGERLAQYAATGAKFTKWRTLFVIDGEITPTDGAINSNVDTLALYASIAQANNLVPMVEPEVQYEGTHSIERAQQVVTDVLKKLFERLALHKVDLGGLLLKSSMVLPGKQSGDEASPEQVAQATVEAFHASVPKEVAGIVFLSGGQTPVQASQNLNAIANLGTQPWPITFSFSRALQDPVMGAWAGKDQNEAKAQEIFQTRLANTVAALGGNYQPSMDQNV